MNRSIVDKVLNSVYNEDSAKPDNQQKPEQKPEDNKPGGDNTQKPEGNKPENPDNKPSEQTYDINSAEFQKIVRDEFYRLLDNYRDSRGKGVRKHHWACEESSMMKATDMIEKGYFDHYSELKYPHIISSSECAAGQWLEGSVTKDAGIALANRLFNQFKNSESHNRILLKDININDVYDGHFAIDGFSFYAKKSNYNESFGGAYPKRRGSNVYMIKAVYHSSTSSKLKYTDDTTNDAYKPKLSSIPEENVQNIVEMFE